MRDNSESPDGTGDPDGDVDAAGDPDETSVEAVDDPDGESMDGVGDSVGTHGSELVDATADADDAVSAAAGALRAGDLVVLPTDTVYGVAADAFNPSATDKIFTAKRRQRRYPLPVLIRSPKQLIGLVPEVSDAAENLMAAYWPGPLTIVVRTDPNLAWDLGRNENTVAVRMPMDDVTLAIIRSVGPLAVTSANLSGQAAATTARLAQTQLGEAVAVYVDAGRRASTEPSTIVDLTRRDPVVLRPGPLDDDEVLAVARGELAPHLAGGGAPPAEKPISPGGPAETTPDSAAGEDVPGTGADDDVTAEDPSTVAGTAAGTAAAHRSTDHRAVDHRAAASSSGGGSRRRTRRTGARATTQAVDPTPPAPEPPEPAEEHEPAVAPTPDEPSSTAEPEPTPVDTAEPGDVDAGATSSDEPPPPTMRPRTQHVARDHRASPSRTDGRGTAGER